MVKAENLTVVDSNQARINRLNELQEKAREVIAQKIGSQYLADMVAGKPHNSMLNLPELYPLNPNNDEYDGYTQGGIYEIPASPDGTILALLRDWKTDVVHYAGGSFLIKTSRGGSEFIASCNPNREIELRAIMPFTEYYAMFDTHDGKSRPDSQMARLVHLFGYLVELPQGEKTMISVTFSSIPEKSHLDLPIVDPPIK